MFIDLKSVFADENYIVPLQYDFDFSDISQANIKVLPGLVPIKGRIFNRAGIVQLDATAELTYTAPCDRCMKEAARKIPVAIRHLLVPVQSGEGNEEMILVPDMQLDLYEVCRTDIILALPTKFLCKPDCKGLCPNCGVDLNEHDCKCNRSDVDSTDPRLRNLQKLL